MKKIAVIGDSCIDKYIYGSCERLSPEGPVPILNKKSEISTSGMSGNVYKNLLNLVSDSVSVIHYSNPDYSIEKIRFVEEKTNQLLLRLDINDKCDRITENKLKLIKGHKYDVIVISDYCKGFMKDSDLIELGKSAPMSFLDSKRKLTLDIIESFNLIKLNEYEYNLNKELVDKFPNRFVITLGNKGVKFLNKIYPPSKIIQTYDVSGAGDTFLAALVSKLVDDINIYDAIAFAQECCNKVIQRRGTCVYEKDMD